MLPYPVLLNHQMAVLADHITATMALRISYEDGDHCLLLKGHWLDMVCKTRISFHTLHSFVPGAALEQAIWTMGREIACRLQERLGLQGPGVRRVTA